MIRMSRTEVIKQAARRREINIISTFTFTRGHTDVSLYSSFTMPTHAGSLVLFRGIFSLSEEVNPAHVKGQRSHLTH